MCLIPFPRKKVLGESKPPPAEMSLVESYLDKISMPTRNDVIYKDECVYSFDNPETPTGLYVNLKTFLGFGEEFVRRYAERTGNIVFLHIQREKKLKHGISGKDETAPGNSNITRLANGLEGGYNDSKKYDYQDKYSIVIFTKKIVLRLPYPDKNLPAEFSNAVEAVLMSDAAVNNIKKQTVTGTWDGEERKVSRYSEQLLQLNNGKKIPPIGWKCEKCELTSNLWLNLTDGSILCGRRFFDGSGGNDHAVEHYKQYGYPLAVKLGTISSDGQTDVYSYPEDDMVIDSKLEEHLAHFGISMSKMKKSEKSMVEMELEINQRAGEWTQLTECDSELQPLNGAGYTGMRNLGNSCYLNSIMQVLFTVPDFIERYTGNGAEKYFATFPPDPANDFNVQMSKLGNGLWSGKYSMQSEQGITPSMFKAVIGKNHKDFRSKQQQDAYEFFLHIINLLEQHSRDQRNPGDAFKFLLEERMECMSSGKVKYTYREEHCLPLVIPLKNSSNVECIVDDIVAAADKDAARYNVSFEACVEKFLAAELIDQFYSSAVNAKTKAEKTTRLSTMPDYLMIHLLKFHLGEDWLPKKLNVAIDMPDNLDISNWRATGLQPGEVQLPESTSAIRQTSAADFVYDELILSELMSFGFTLEAAKRAVYHTQNAGLDAASEWLTAHLSDLDINEPFDSLLQAGRSSSSGTNKANTAFQPDSEHVAQLMGMGFNERLATSALRATSGNIEQATEWIFAHMHDPISDEAAAAPPLTKSQSKSCRDGVGRYKLLAFISHMGQTAQVGHYVCHIRKKGKWVLFNDEKVALSKTPPTSLGYLYLYKREK